MHGQVNDSGVLRLHRTVNTALACEHSRGTHLPNLFNLLLILQESTPPNEPLTGWARAAGADLGDLVLDIANGGRWWYLDFKGMGIRRELNSDGRHEVDEKQRQGT